MNLDRIALSRVQNKESLHAPFPNNPFMWDSYFLTYLNLSPTNNFAQTDLRCKGERTSHKAVDPEAYSYAAP